MEVCTYQSVACSTTMWGEEDSLLFIYMRVALGNGRTDASSVVYVRRTPSELPSARDGQTCRLDIHTWTLVSPAGRERASERDIPYTCTSETRRSFQPLIHSQNTSFSSKCRKQQAFFPVSLSSYRILSFVWRWGQIGGKIRKEIYRYSFG